MIPLEQALALLQQTINKNLVHQDYDRVCKFAEEYEIFITGENAEKLLKRVVRREDVDMFEQRKALTETITPAIANSIMNPFYRVGRLDNIKRELIYNGSVNEQDSKRAELEEKIGNYYGAKSLDEYLQTRFIQLSFTDPNAFILTTFDTFDSNREKATPYPFEVSSQEAINYNYKNNILEWLIVKYAIVYLDKDNKPQAGYSYTMYLGEYVLKYTQVDSRVAAFNLLPAFVTPRGGLVNFNSLNTERYYLTDDKRAFELAVYQPKAKVVQAVRVGYVDDTKTKGRTFVNPFHAALCWFKKTIKSNSEQDLQMALHAFQQKLQYVPRCSGESIEKPCRNGYGIDGSECRVCHGTGWSPIVSTTQDTLTLPMPRDRSDEPIALKDIVHYVQQDTSLLTILDNYIDKLIERAIKTVFNSDTTQKPQVQETATKVIVTKDEMYNTLEPFATHYEQIYKYKTHLIATFTDLDTGLEVNYKFPSDFKLKTLDELYEDRRKAKESGASAFALQEIDRDIARIQYKDDDRAYKRYLVKERFMPFLGKSEQQIAFIISSGLARKLDVVLYTHSDTIIDDLENRIEDFYLLPYKQQWVLIEKEANVILKQLPADNTAIEFRQTPEPVE